MKIIKSILTIFLFLFITITYSEQYETVQQYVKDSKKGSNNYLENVLKNSGYGDSKTSPIHKFNTVFGIPSVKDIISVTEYYNNIKSPVAWWFPKIEKISENKLFEYGWQFEETDIGMYLNLNEYQPKILDSPLKIVLCKTKKDYIDFGKVLSSIFEPENMEESENIQLIYSMIGDNANKLTNNLFHFVGYYDVIPVTTASVYFSNDNAGIFDIATPAVWRKRGFGSAIFKYALNFVKKQKKSICFLQASQDGLNIYKSVGFKEKFQYEVCSFK